MNQACLIVRPVTAEDFREYTGVSLPVGYMADGTTVVGFAATRGDRLVALGLVTWDLNGRAWAWFDARERIATATMHRRALEMLAVLRAVEEPALHVFCSQTIPGAARWLKRLGFCPAPELTTDPKFPVWACKISN